MASPNVFTVFREQVAKGLHDFDTHTYKIRLLNTVPSASNEVIADLPSEIAAGNGYTAGGATVTVTNVSTSGSIATVYANDVDFTASGGDIAAFRYPVLVNSTTNALVCWWDRGVSSTIPNGDTFRVQVSPTNGLIQFSLA
jgi:hypothetical protein